MGQVVFAPNDRLDSTSSGAFFGSERGVQSRIQDLEIWMVIRHCIEAWILFLEAMGSWVMSVFNIS